jgi:hypothetical protein
LYASHHAGHLAGHADTDGGGRRRRTQRIDHQRRDGHLVELWSSRSWHCIGFIISFMFMSAGKENIDISLSLVGCWLLSPRDVSLSLAGPG